MTSSNTTSKAAAETTVLKDEDLAPVAGGLELPIAPIGAVDATQLPPTIPQADPQLLNPIANPMAPNPNTD